MQTVTLTPKLQLHQNIHQDPPVRSINHALHGKLVRWIEKTSTQIILRRLMRFASIVGLALLIFAPQFALGYLTAVLKWNSFRIPIFLASSALMLNMKRLITALRRHSMKRTNGNQHTLYGLTVGDLSAFLKETGCFKRDEAISKFALSQGRYSSISETLKKHGLLYHGENNAYTLRDISHENLVLQLRAIAAGKVPPLVYEPDREIWVERDGVFSRWALDQDFKQRKLEEGTARAEKKLKRIRAQSAALSA